MNFTRFVILCALVGTQFFCNAQSNPKLSIKIGGTRTFFDPFHQDRFAYQGFALKSPYPNLGFEYSKPWGKKGKQLFLGFMLEPTAFSASVHTQNFTWINPGGTSSMGNYVFKPYGLVEFGIGRKKPRLSSNYFSGALGVGVSIHPNIDLRGATHGQAVAGQTKDGRTFGNPYVDNEVGWTPGYKTVVYVDSDFPVSPTVMASIRWHLRNRKGREPVVLELGGNFGPFSYFRYYIPYTLDGRLYVDEFKERGTHLQLNVIMPLKVWRKKTQTLDTR